MHLIKDDRNFYCVKSSYLLIAIEGLGKSIYKNKTRYIRSMYCHRNWEPFFTFPFLGFQ